MPTVTDLQTRIAIHLMGEHDLEPVNPLATPLGLEGTCLSLFLPENPEYRKQRLLHEKDQGLLAHGNPEIAV